MHEGYVPILGGYMVVLPAPRRSGTDPRLSPGFSFLDKVISLMSVLTMLSTVPQALQVWVGSARGVSLVSWASYLVAACLWLIHGVRKHDKSIYLACIGWIILDAAIVIGVIVRQ
jgi:uncharacterized protein with PQ loop repeat